MEGNSNKSRSDEYAAKKGLEGTGIDLPVNRHGNLKSASSDQNLNDILLHIKSSKTPVSLIPSHSLPLLFTLFSLFFPFMFLFIF